MYFVLSSPEVKFCAYTIPHPAEKKMVLQIQTIGGVEAINILRRGLQDLGELCDYTVDTFEKAISDHKEKCPAAYIPPPRDPDTSDDE